MAPQIPFDMQSPPRLTNCELPSYAYVPRMHPHPFSDPKGHSYREGPKSIELSKDFSAKDFSAKDFSINDFSINDFSINDFSINDFSINDFSIKRQNEWAIDLFNHGYYWESHEAWEAIWVTFQRVGTQADFVKGLIKLAAAGVKAREGNTNGVQRHAKRAAELFDLCTQADVGSCDRLLGMSSAWLRRQCRVVSEQPELFTDSTRCDVKRIFPFSLVPSYDPF